MEFTTSPPICLSSISRFFIVSTSATHHIQGEECIYLDEPMQIPKDNGNWDKPDIHGITVEMWNQLDDFCENQPDGKTNHDRDRSPLRDLIGSFEEEPSHEAIHNQSGRTESRKVQSIRTPRLLPIKYISGY